MKRRRWLWVVLGLVGLGMALIFRSVMGYVAYTLIGRLSPTLSPDLALLFQVELSPEDLPPGWYWEGTKAEEVPNGEGRFTWFYHTSAKDLLVVSLSETVLVYPDIIAAREGYQTQIDIYFPAGSKRWRDMPELQFSHHAEEAKTACLELYFREVSGDVYHHYACTYIARYGRVVIVVLGNVFDDQWLTMSEFRDVLIAADRKAARAVGLIVP
ncbi:MAG: hypothetical protein ACPLYD_16305 [Anaerolineae bacterium]